MVQQPPIFPCHPQKNFVLVTLTMENFQLVWWNIFLSTLCDPSQLMELEVTSIYSDTRDKSVTNQILGSEPFP